MRWAVAELARIGAELPEPERGVFNRRLDHVLSPRLGGVCVGANLAGVAASGSDRVARMAAVGAVNSLSLAVGQLVAAGLRPGADLAATFPEWLPSLDDGDEAQKRLAGVA
jgi:hypothetical protein